MAIESYRLDKGKLPEGLDALTPGYIEPMPKDPFDGKFLRYKKLHRGYAVYSVGADLTDDGAREGDGLRQGFDVTFIVER